MDEILKSSLDKLYFDAKSPSGFSSAKKLHDAARKAGLSVTLNKIKEYLEDNLTYSLHKQKRIRFRRARVIFSHVNEQFCADLTEMQQYATQNSGMRYILTVIDCLSKFAFAIPLKNKSATTVAGAMEQVVKQRHPSKLQTDKGSEFCNTNFQELMKKYRIHHFTSQNADVKVSIVERFNRTLKHKLFKICTAQGTRKWLPHLQDVVKAYNSTVHSTTKMRPIDVTHSNEYIAFRNTFGVGTKRELLMRINQESKSDSLKKGDTVRIAYAPGVFERGFFANWEDQTHKVINVKPGSGKKLFKLKDKKESFYNEQLQKTNSNPTYRIERVIKTRIRNGVKEAYVKFLNYSSAHNQWLLASDITPVSTLA